MNFAHLLSTSYRMCHPRLARSAATLPGLRRLLVASTLLSLMLLAPPAKAVQPLETFLSAARTHSFQAREQQARARQRNWEQKAALGRLLPSFSARGIYQRNQYEVAVQLPGTEQRLVISPYNQLDAILQLDVPLVDLANYYRYSQAQHFARAEALAQELVGTELDQAVSGAYFSYVGAWALRESAHESVTMAEENATLVQARREVGVATELDVERARSNVERARRDLADAELVLSISARTLETITGVSPAPVRNYPNDDLRTEAPLQNWLAMRDTPADRVQAERREAADDADRAARAAMLPTLGLVGQERLTNATGFAGRSSVYSIQAVLSWRLDYGSYATARAAAAATEVEQIRTEQVRRNVEDTIYEAYHRVEAGIAKSTAARAQAEAARHAAELALDRYQAGALTQLDVTQSQRELFQAQAARIQADADLALARIVLRVVAGRPATEALLATRAAPLTPSAPPPNPSAR